MREDPSDAGYYGRSELVKIEKGLVHLNRQGKLDPEDDHTYAGPGTAPSFREYRAKCSLMNLVKMEVLQKDNKELAALWAATLEGRRANSKLNNFLGDELTNLLRVAADSRVAQDEIARKTRQHGLGADTFGMKPCAYYTGRGCRHDDCPYLYLEQ